MLTNTTLTLKAKYMWMSPTPVKNQVWVHPEEDMTAVLLKKHKPMLLTITDVEGCIVKFKSSTGQSFEQAIELFQKSYCCIKAEFSDLIQEFSQSKVTA